MYKLIIVILLICCFCPLSGLGQIDTVFINKDYVNELGDSITVKSAETGFNVYKTDSTSCLIQYEYWRYLTSGDCANYSLFKREFGTLKSRNPDVKSGLIKRYYSDYSAENIELYSDGNLVSIISQVSFKTFPFDTISPPIYELTDIASLEKERIYSENKFTIQQLLPNEYRGLLADKSQLPPSSFWLKVILNKQGVIESVESERLLDTEFMQQLSAALVNQQLSPFMLNNIPVRTSFSLPLNIHWK